MDSVDKLIKQWNTECPSLNVGPMETLGRIKKIAHFSAQKLQKNYTKHGLNHAAFDMLATLKRSGPPYALTPNDLIKQTMVTSGTMTHRIDQLQKDGFIERLPNPKDARGAIIKLTPAGKEKIEATLKDHTNTQDNITQALTTAEQKTLDAILRKLLLNLENSEN